MMMIAVEETAPESPAASAKGTVRPSAMPMTISRTRAGARKCFSTWGVAGMRHQKRPGCAAQRANSLAPATRQAALITARHHAPQEGTVPNIVTDEACCCTEFRGNEDNVCGRLVDFCKLWRSALLPGSKPGNEKNPKKLSP